MRWIPKIVSMLLLWGVVAYFIVYVNPALVKNTAVPGVYLPLLVPLFAALWYTLTLVFRKPLHALILTIIAVGTLVLSILKVLYPELGAVLGAATLFVLYLTFIH